MTSTNLCSACKKSVGVCLCVGCKAYFCGKDFTEHRGELHNKLDGFLVGINDLKDKINKTVQSNESDTSLLSRIDEWQQAVIEKIRQAAEEARKEIHAKVMDSSTNLTDQFESLFKEFIEMKETEGFIEQDLTRLKQRIQQLNEDTEGSTQLLTIELYLTDSDQIAWNQLINIKNKKSTNIEVANPTSSTLFTFQIPLISNSNIKSPFSTPNEESLANENQALQTPSLTNNNKPATSGSIHDSPFVFGTRSVDITTTGNNDEDDNDEENVHEPNVSFRQIVQLPAVEVKTGEENENVLFCERAKLYRFDAEANQIKERGVGEMKILQHKTTKVCRVLMRREQVLKLCANHQITSPMVLKPHQGSANVYVWSAMDFADGEVKHETFCIRFNTEKQAKHFYKIFNEAKEINANKASGNDDVRPSAEQIDRAKKLQLPSTFFLYENKEPCRGCIGCKDDTPSVASDENKTTTTTVHADVAKNDSKTTYPQTASTIPAFKPSLNSNENIKFSFVNPEKSQSQPKQQKSTIESSSNTTTPQKDKKPSSTTNGGLNFPGFGNTTTTPKTGFQFSTPVGTPTTATTTATTTANTSSRFSFGSTNKPVFDGAPKFSFLDVAKQSSSTNDDKPTINGTEQRVFAKQGSLVFGTNSTYTTTTGSNHENDNDEE